VSAAEDSRFARCFLADVNFVCEMSESVFATSRLRVRSPIGRLTMP
jgi:hypothetical protein